MKTLSPALLTQYKIISGLNLSPCGQWSTYHIHESHLETNTYTSNLWATHLTDNRTIQLTTSGMAASHIWLASTQQIIYPSLKDEKVKAAKEKGEPLTAFYTLSLSPGESQEYMQVPLNVTDLKSIDDDLFVLTATYDPSYTAFDTLSEEEKETFYKNKQEEKNYEVIEEIPYWHNGGDFTRGCRNRLYLYQKSTKVITPLSETDQEIEYFEYFKDTNQILYTARTFTDRRPPFNDLYAYDFKCPSKKLTQTTFEIKYAYPVDQHRIILLATNKALYGLNENKKFYSLDLNTFAMEPLCNEFDAQIGNSVGSDCRYGNRRTLKAFNNALYFISTENDSTYLNKLDPSGTLIKLSSLSGSVDDFDISKSHIVINAMRGNRLGELYALESTKEERPLTQFNTWVEKTFTLSTPEPISAQGGSETTIQGWVMKPIPYDPTQKYPSILNIHGGPKTVYGPSFYHEMQVWANEGYFVYFCNPRGSDGRGNAFADIRGKYGTIDYEDIMAFAETVYTAYPQIDPNNLFVTGGSYGGFMTNWIIGHTKRFKAAVSQRSISNWTTEYGLTDIGYYFVTDQLGTDPWLNYEEVWDKSPLKYANQAVTPTLFIHSDKDYRCWIPEALQMFTALKQFDVPTRLCWFKGENHELSRSGNPKHRLRRLKEISDWFKKWQSHE